MSLCDRKPSILFKNFSDYINGILNKILTAEARLIPNIEETDPQTVTIRFDRPSVRVPGTEYYFSIKQVLYAFENKEAGRRKEKFCLRTDEYLYALYKKPKEPPIMRFDYEKFKKPHCRHHLHLLTHLDGLDLKHCHIPTGWVTIEEFIRFLILDLKARALCNNWHDVLVKSESIFYGQFSTKWDHTPYFINNVEK